MKRQITLMFSLLVLSACTIIRHHKQFYQPDNGKHTVPAGIRFAPSVMPEMDLKLRYIDTATKPDYRRIFDRIYKTKFDSLTRVLSSMPGIIQAHQKHADSLYSANVDLTNSNYKSAIQQQVLTKIAIDAVASKQDAMSQNIKSLSEVNELLKRLDTMQIMPYLIIAFFILLFIAATPDLIKALFAVVKRKRLEVEIKKLHNAK